VQDSFALRQEIRKRDGELATVGVVTLVKIDLSTRTVPGELTAPLRT
jgi:acyl-CoA thioesterase FadM